MCTMTTRARTYLLLDSTAAVVALLQPSACSSVKGIFGSALSSTAMFL